MYSVVISSSENVEATIKEGLAFASLHKATRNRFFWLFFFSLSTFSMCYFHSDLMVLHFGPFTWQFHFKEKQKARAFNLPLLYVYGLLFSTALKRCVKLFDHMCLSKYY